MREAQRSARPRVADIAGILNVVDPFFRPAVGHRLAVRVVRVQQEAVAEAFAHRGLQRVVDARPVVRFVADLADRRDRAAAVRANLVEELQLKQFHAAIADVAHRHREVGQNLPLVVECPLFAVGDAVAGIVEEPAQRGHQLCGVQVLHV